MSQKDKLIERFKRLPTDFTYDESVSLLKIFGYREYCNDGSRRSFIHAPDNHIIYIHKPHPGNIVKMYALKDVKQTLEEHGYL